jgi:hypothetical protein
VRKKPRPTCMGRSKCLEDYRTVSSLGSRCCIQTLGSTQRPKSCSRFIAIDCSAPGPTYSPLSGEIIPAHSSHSATVPVMARESGIIVRDSALSLRWTRSQGSKGESSSRFHSTYRSQGVSGYELCRVGRTGTMRESISRFCQRAHDTQDFRAQAASLVRCRHEGGEGRERVRGASTTAVAHRPFRYLAYRRRQILRGAVPGQGYGVSQRNEVSGGS